MRIYMMTTPVASRLRRTSAFTQLGEGQWCVHVPQSVMGTYPGSMFQPAAGIQSNPNSIRSRVGDAAKPGSPPRGAPR